MLNVKRQKFFHAEMQGSRYMQEIKASVAFSPSVLSGKAFRDTHHVRPVHGHHDDSARCDVGL